MPPQYEKIEGQALDAALQSLEGWSLVEGKLHREFKFADFSEAFGFMSRTALDIHLIDHHPEWFNVYGTVVVDLVTHFTGGITDRDVRLAQRMNEIAGE